MSCSTDGWCPRRLRGRQRSVHVGDKRRFSSLRQPEQSWHRLKVVYSSPLKPTSELWSVACHMGSHSVTCHPSQLNTPHLNPSQASQYSIYLPWRDGRLSWPWWLVIYGDGIPVCRQSPIQSALLWLWNNLPVGLRHSGTQALNSSNAYLRCFCLIEAAVWISLCYKLTSTVTCLIISSGVLLFQPQNVNVRVPDVHTEYGTRLRSLFGAD